MPNTPSALSASPSTAFSRGHQKRHLTATAIAAALTFACLLPLTSWPARAQTVSIKDFRAILTELTARPNLPPRIAPPQPTTAFIPPSRAIALKACNIPRRDIVFAVPRLLDDEPGKPTRYRVDRERFAILADDRRHSRGAVFAVAEKFAVNADASPRSYHPLDPFGRCTLVGTTRVCALDALCSAGVRIFERAHEIKCQNRDAYAAAWKEIWAHIAAGRATTISRRYWRLDRTGATATHYGFFHPTRPMSVIMRHNIIPQDRKGRPCIRDAAGARFAGYFVSKTSLKGDQGADEREGPGARSIVSDQLCNPLPYADPEVLPGVVIPVGGFAGASVGDLAVVYRKDSQNTERFVYAVVSDQGPNHKFGEGSIALNAALKGVTPKLNSIADIYALDIRGQADRRESIGVLIMRRTKTVLGQDHARRSIDTAVAKAFARWGGGTIAMAQKRYRACLTALK